MDTGSLIITSLSHVGMRIVAYKKMKGMIFSPIIQLLTGDAERERGR